MGHNVIIVLGNVFIFINNYMFYSKTCYFVLQNVDTINDKIVCIQNINIFHNKMRNIFHKVNTFIDKTCSSININMFPNNDITLPFFTYFFVFRVLSMAMLFFSPPSHPKNVSHILSMVMFLNVVSGKCCVFSSHPAILLYVQT